MTENIYFIHSAYCLRFNRVVDKITLMLASSVADRLLLYLRVYKAFQKAVFLLRSNASQYPLIT